MLRFKSLASGSAGNASLVQASDGLNTTTILIDCGLSIRTLQKRMAEAGLGIEALDAIFITHEHTDHIGCAHALSVQKNIPIYMSHGTWVSTGKNDYADLLHIALDIQNLHIGALQLTPFTVPHDAREPLQLKCSDGARQLGILTDLGHASQHVLSMLADCSSLILECNHDESMLASSKYPPFLRQRIGGDWGHLSNTQAQHILQNLNKTKLKHVLGAHLSVQNNTEALAQNALAAGLGCKSMDILLANQEHGSPWLDV